MDKQQILDMIKMNMSNAEIAKILNIHPNALNELYKTFEIKKTKKIKLNNDQIEEIKKLINIGVKRKIICDKFDITYPTLKKFEN